MSGGSLHFVSMSRRTAMHGLTLRPHRRIIVQFTCSSGRVPAAGAAGPTEWRTFIAHG